jgi:hypothetical protein
VPRVLLALVSGGLPAAEANEVSDVSLADFNLKHRHGIN